MSKRELLEYKLRLEAWIKVLEAVEFFAIQYTKKLNKEVL
jgi:hypothetical protein